MTAGCDTTAESRVDRPKTPAPIPVQGPRLKPLINHSPGRKKRLPYDRFVTHLVYHAPPLIVLI